MGCGVLEKVTHRETGEVFTIVQLEITNPYNICLKGEDGQVVNHPIDLLVCSTCKSRIFALGLDVFLCETSLREIYARTGETVDVLWASSRTPSSNRPIHNSLDGRGHDSI
jgi:hypothetical protein